MRLPIQTGSDNVILRTKSKEVKKIDKVIIRLIRNMRITLEAENGLGLAAPQVGFNLRLILARLNHGTEQEMVVPMINPELTSLSTEKRLRDEGCLSIPAQFDKVIRYDEVIVKFLDQKGKNQVLKLKGLNAQILQHEVDHINGILYIDHLRNDEIHQKSELSKEQEL